MSRKFIFILIAFAAISAAFTDKELYAFNKRYKWSSSVYLGDGIYKHYVTTDLTDIRAGVDFVCNADNRICTIEADEVDFLTDEKGRYTLSTRHSTHTFGSLVLP